MFPKWWKFGGARPMPAKKDDRQTELPMPAQPTREHEPGVGEAVIFLRKNGYKVKEAGRDHYVGEKLLSDGQVLLLAQHEGWSG